MFDCYFEEVKETQGYIFEQFVLQGYDFKDSVTKYMKSELKYRIDLRHPKETNFLGSEQIDALKKEVNLIYKKDSFDPFLANWLGEYYATLQLETQIPSRFLLYLFPVANMMNKANGLHDYDMSLAVQKSIKGLQLDVIGFHNPKDDYSFLSNWYNSEFKCNGVKFTSMEQCMMYGKALLFDDECVAKQILDTNDFVEIKALGRQVHGFREHFWRLHRERIVFEGLSAKFSQNLNLKELLLGTGDKILVECAVKDKIWGAGLSLEDDYSVFKNWSGLNLLGFNLMRVRDTFK